jgi:two-component system C4-dicarboxylate transport sensor histidine kinase DctB
VISAGNLRSRLAWLAGAALALAVVLVTYSLAERANIRALREATTHRMDIYSASLLAEMNRFEYLPPVVALNEQVVHLLKSPDDEASHALVNRYLQTVNLRAGASAIYVMNLQGLTLASSNWNQPATFVNMNFAYRPYFQDAVRGFPGRFYGIGTVSREAGYYFAHAIASEGVTIGVVAVKLNLEKLDAAWGHEGEKIAVADGNGVIFLSSEANWKYRTLKTLSRETMGRLQATRQYSEAGLLSPLNIKREHLLDDGTAIVTIEPEPIEKRPSDTGPEFLVHENRILGTDWRLLVLSDLKPARASARNSAALAVLTCVLLAVLALFFQQRRRIVAQTVAARVALQRANDELEQKVAQRTEALSEANEALQVEVTERKRAEEALRAALEDLVHTAKMAALGQMSAGITHELNQPLAALRTLSANAIVFMNRGDLKEAEANLSIIVRVTEHMGKITAQLKKFARKSTPELRPVVVSAVANDALFLLRQSTRASTVDIELRIQPPALQALCDSNRLEQVLLNLLSNAIDAVEGVAHPKVLLHVWADSQWVCIAVHDNGAGIRPDVAARLFEPFFSTKDQGVGLGLGLAISASIVRDLGGTIRGAESEELGGAKFVVLLKAVAKELAYA